LTNMEKVITNSNFQEILKSSKVVVVDFWATWCGPCRMLAPTVDEVASEYEGRAVIAKCNVDDCQEIAEQFRIMSIPTIVYFKDGEAADKTVGVVSKSDIVSRIEKLL